MSNEEEKRCAESRGGKSRRFGEWASDKTEGEKMLQGECKDEA